MLGARDMRIGCRMRRNGYADRYPYDFTLRAKRDSGAVTELSKVTDGWGDFLFYGHAGAEFGQIARWMLIDLHAWRAQMIRSKKRAGNPQLVSNKDGTYFTVFDATKFVEQPPVVIGSNFPIQVTGWPLKISGDTTPDE